MGKFIMAVLLITVVAAALISGCIYSVSSDLSSQLQEPHNLRKISEKDIPYSESSSSWGGMFFVFLGAAGGSSHSTSTVVRQVQFSWEENNNGVYITSVLPREMVRVKIAEEKMTPTVQFFFKSKSEYTGDYDYLGDGNVEITKEIFDDNPQRFIANYVAYVMVTCNKEDWPEEIVLPS